MLVPSDAQRRFLEKASKEYHEQLAQVPAAVTYLMDERGLTEEVIERFRLGVVADPLPGHEQYRGKLVIPYLTNYGIAAIRFRRLGDSDGTKYLSMAGDPPRIYNPAALGRGTVGICVAEGELDCITAEMCGLPCIGLPGANSWIPIWARLLAQYDQVMLLCDDDEAGRGLADKLSKDLPHNLRPVTMDEGDVNSFFLQHGREALRKKVIG